LFKAVLTAVALLVAGLVTLLVARSARGGATAGNDVVQAPPAMTVTTVQVKQQDWDEALTASGAIAAWQESVVGAPLAGLRLVSVEVDVGAVIRKGQVLARFDDALLQADAQRLQALLAQADAESARARRDAERAQALRPSGALSEQSVLLTLTEAESAAAAVRSARAALKAKQVEIDYAVVRAADDGVISERSATLGAVPERGEPLFRFIRQQRLEWRGELGAAQLAKVRVGQRVRLTLPDGSSANAQLRQIAPTLGDAARMGRVYADLPVGSAARAGMYVQGEIGLARSPAQVVPASALVVRDGRSLVFTVNADGGAGHVSARTVTVARRRQRQVDVGGSLEPGAWVVDQGAGFLAEGDRVQIVAGRAATAPVAAGTR